MTNIQLVQKFASDKLFEKLHRVDLKCWVAYAEYFSKLDEDELKEVIYVINKVTEWRELQKNLTITNSYE